MLLPDSFIFGRANKRVDDARLTEILHLATFKIHNYYNEIEF